MLDYSEIKENSRTIETEKSSYTIELDRHHHLWKIKPASGPVPADLSGGYTSANTARIALTNYLNIRDKRKS